MSWLGLRISALTISLLGVVPLAAASIPVTTGESESDSDTFPDTDTGEGSMLITIVEPATNDVFSGTPDAAVQVTIEFEDIFDGKEIHLDSQTRLDGDGPWTTVKEDMCPAGLPPCTIPLTLSPDTYMLRAWAEGPGGATEFDVVIIEVVDAAATDTDAGETESSGSETAGETAGETESGGSAGETDTSPTSSATGEQPGDDSSGGTTVEAPETEGDPLEDGDKGCGCSTGATGPDILGLALAALLVPWRRRRR
jgi:MYXO-CTERM domain-containing protein